MDRNSSEQGRYRAPSPLEIEVLRALFIKGRDSGRYSEAINFAQEITERFPDDGFGWKALAELQQRAGHPLIALAVMQKGAALAPSDAQLQCSLGSALQKSGRLAEAEASYGRALQLRPDYAEAHHELGNVLQARGRIVEAEASFRQALRLKPDVALTHHNLGAVISAQGRFAEAVTYYRRALQLRSDVAETHSNLGNALQQQGQLVAAEASFRQALRLKPDLAPVHSNLAVVLQAMGRLAEAEISYQQALRLRPEDAYAHSNLLLHLNYQTGKTNEAVFNAHRVYEARFGTRFHTGRPEYNRRRKRRGTHGQLRVGYVSPDFRQHSVACFISPLLREHDRDTVEVFCYADVARPDAVTSALRALADHWLDAVGLSDSELAERIAADEIDILVDLAGHTARNRLPVFARQAAPIQITWLGYPNTTGLSSMGYRLVDAVTDPCGEADRWASETLIRLDDGFLCFEPAADAPLPHAPPCLCSGAITFACFNNPAKLSSAALAAWIQLLDRVPGSRLVLKGKGFAEEATRARFLGRVAQGGGDPQRVILLGLIDSLADHLEAYGQVDIALDPFPYNGVTTTCEALWMGVPTVTLLGTRHAGRVGASLLTRVGLTELIAHSVDAYVDIAAVLAADRGHLSALRHTMRERMRTSSLCDAKKFTRKIEATYRALAQRHRVT